MPCQSRTAQPQSVGSSPACTVHAPRPPVLAALAGWLTHAQRKRTDDDDSPPWLYPAATPGGQRAVGVRTRRARPLGPHPHSVSHCARPRDGVRAQPQEREENWGENEAPLQRVVGAFVHKRREDGSEGLTTLHTTPLHSTLPSPHTTELSPSISRARTHTLLSLSLSPSLLSPSVHESRELESSCSHGGGSPAPPAAAGHVHRLRRGVLRVQDGRARPGDAGGDRLRLQQGRGLRVHRQGRAVLRQRQQGGRLLLHLQQLLPEPQRHGRHLRLQRRRHPHRHRPQLRHLQVRLRTQQRRHRRRHRHGRRHRRDRRWHHRRWWHGRRHRHRHRHRRWHWSRHGYGRWDGDEHRHRHWHRRGDHGPREHPEPTVRRHGRLRPIRSRQHRLQRRRRAARPRAARGGRPCARSRRRTSPPLGAGRGANWAGAAGGHGTGERVWACALSDLCVPACLMGFDRSAVVSVAWRGWLVAAARGLLLFN